MWTEYDNLSAKQQDEVYRRYENIVNKEINKEFDARHDWLVEELNSFFGCHFEQDDIVIHNNGLYGISIFVWWLFTGERYYIDIANITSEKLLKDFSKTCKNADRAYKLIRSLQKNSYIYIYIADDFDSIEFEEYNGYEGCLYPRIRKLLRSYKDYLEALLKDIISDCKADIDYYCNENSFVEDVFSNYLFNSQTLKIRRKKQ